MARWLPLLLVLSACNEVTLTKDAGVDAGFECHPVDPPADAGAELYAVLTLCPTQGSIFFDSSFFTVLGPDGGVVHAAGDPCQACDRCPGTASCDPFAFVAEVPPQTQRTVVTQLDGREETDGGTCAATGTTCGVRTPQPPGAYRGRFCVSRTATRDAQGEPAALGPLECVERPFRLPFAVGGVAATFE